MCVSLDRAGVQHRSTAPADAGLPPDYAVLGQVTEGMDVVDAISRLGDPATEKPLQTVTIDSIAISEG